MVASDCRLICPAAFSDAAIRPSVCPFVCRSHLGQLGAQRFVQATRDVRTADLSAHGRRSAAIGGGHIVSPRGNFFCILYKHVHTCVDLHKQCCNKGRI